MPRLLLFAILFLDQALYLCATIEADPLPSAKANARKANVMNGPALPFGRGSHAGAMLQGHVVVVASGSAWSKDGTTKQWLSDTLLFRDGKWSTGPSLPHPAVEAAFASDRNHLYILGGLTNVDKPSADTFELSLDRDGRLNIAALPELPVRNVGGAAAILNGQLFVVGGYVDGKVCNMVRVLDLNQSPRSWVERSSFPSEPRAYAALVAAGGQLYLIGGMVNDHDVMRVFKDVLNFNPKTDAWTVLGDLPTAGYCWAATPIDENETQLLIAGRADGAIHDDLWIVDLADLSVRSIGRSVVTQTCAPLVKIDRSTYWLIGGEPDANKHRTERVTQIRLR